MKQQHQNPATAELSAIATVASPVVTTTASTTLSTTTATKAEKWPVFAAGWTSGFVTSLLLHPIDLLKTRMQAQGKSGPHGMKYSSSFQLLANIVKQNPAGLYAGLSTNLVGNCVAWGLYFGIYDIAKQARKTHTEKSELNTVDYLLCSAATGTIVQLVTNPLWVVKTRMLLPAVTSAEGVATKSYRGLFDGLRSIWRYEGLSGLYRGIGPGLVGVSHGAVQFMSYDQIKAFAHRRGGLLRPADGPRLEWMDYLVVATTSKVFATVATYPYQVVRTRVQDVNSPYSGSVECVNQILKVEGVRGLYRGLLINVFKVLPNACVVFLVYEETLKRLTLPPTPTP